MQVLEIQKVNKRVIVNFSFEEYIFLCYLIRNQWLSPYTKNKTKILDFALQFEKSLPLE